MTTEAQVLTEERSFVEYGKDSDNLEVCYQIQQKPDIRNFLRDLCLPIIDGNNDGGSWLKKLLEDILDVHPKFTIITEEFHVDREYRDSYYLYFSSQHFEVSRFCKRLSFFKGLMTFELFLDQLGICNNKKDESVCINKDFIQRNYMGCCTIRPLRHNIIGKTLLDPRTYRKSSSELFVRLAEYKTTVHGLKLLVEAFPFSMQDGETTCCIEITLLNLLDYFSKSYPDYHLALPSELIEITQTNTDERVLPKINTYFYIVPKTLSYYGFYPRHYDVCLFAKGEKYEQLKKLVYYYIESGIPVALGLSKDQDESACLDNTGHSIICIGHSNKDADASRIEQKIADIPSETGQIVFIDTAGFFDYYVIMDDTEQPYEEKNITEPFTLDGNTLLKMSNITVPLYRRMYMDACDAETIFQIIEQNPEFGVDVFLKKKDDYSDINKVVKRMYLTTGRNYKNHILSSLDGLYAEYKRVIDSIPFPHFIWVCEYFVPEDYLKDLPVSFGVMLLDGTSNSTKGRDSMLFFRFFDTIAYRMPNQGGDVIIDMIKHSEFKFKHDYPDKQPAYIHNLTLVKPGT
jgi:hypothetical protein